MPSRNSIKPYVEGGYYHVYNRGIEKRPIFLDEQDYAVFLKYLTEYLTDKEEIKLVQRLADPAISFKEKEEINRLLRLNNFKGEICMLSFCLMPNHFHFFLRQTNATSIDKFMNSLCTRYTMYFNKKYGRVGSLYQDVYKALLITSETHFIYLSKYIHKQALLYDQPSSYSTFTKPEGKTYKWVNPAEIMFYFDNKPFSYKTFVEENEETGSIDEFLIEEVDGRCL